MKRKSVMKAGRVSSRAQATRNEDENLQKLSRSNILMSFIKKNRGIWDHETWLELCQRLREKGYEPIDYNKVGLCLEEKKSAYLNSMI